MSMVSFLPGTSGSNIEAGVIVDQASTRNRCRPWTAVGGVLVLVQCCSTIGQRGRRLWQNISSILESHNFQRCGSWARRDDTANIVLSHLGPIETGEAIMHHTRCKVQQIKSADGTQEIWDKRVIACTN